MTTFDDLIKAFMELRHAAEFDNSQARAEDGKWTDGGGGGGSHKTTSKGSAADKVKMPSDGDVESLKKQVADEVEKRMRDRYDVYQEPVTGEWQLRDKTTNGFGGSGWVAVARGDSEQSVKKALDSKVKSAKTRVQKEVAASIGMVKSDISTGFYDSIPDGAQKDINDRLDPNHYLKAFEFKHQPENPWKELIADHRTQPDKNTVWD